MFEDWRRHRAAKRLKHGDGRPLQRFRWWQLLGRSLFYLPLPHKGGGQAVYAIDVRHWRDQWSSDGVVKAHLYLDGRHHAVSKVPAAFPVPGGAVEVAVSAFGIKRCHYVTAAGAEHQLTPDHKSAEGRRARLEAEHPALSRGLGICSLTILILGVVLLLMQIIEPISEVPPVAENIGRFESPVNLPLWLNITLSLAAVTASMERALRLRYNWLLDGAAN